MARKIIGLAGYRQVGKTNITQHLCEKHGFRSVHPFEVWKDGIKAIYMSIGIDEQEAESMVRGSLKDMPHDALPNGHDSRYLMERLGKFAGKDLGPEWTLGLALRQTNLLYPDTDLVIESIVYEVDVVREFGGHIIMVDRPNTNGKGLETDKHTQMIAPDSCFMNDGHNLENLMVEFDAHLREQGLLDQLRLDPEI